MATLAPNTTTFPLVNSSGNYIAAAVQHSTAQTSGDINTRRHITTVNVATAAAATWDNKKDPSSGNKSSGEQADRQAESRQSKLLSAVIC